MTFHGMMHFVPNAILNKKHEYELLIIECWRILTSQKGYLDDVLQLRVISSTKTRNKHAHAIAKRHGHKNVARKMESEVAYIFVWVHRRLWKDVIAYCIFSDR